MQARRLVGLSLFLLSGCVVQMKPYTPKPEPAPSPEPPAAAPAAAAPAGGLVVEKFPTRKKPAKLKRLDPSVRAVHGFPQVSGGGGGDLGEMVIHFIDVGQGDATLIKCPNSDNVIIFDLGGSTGSTAVAPPVIFESSAVKSYIEDLLGSSKRVHGLFVSHPDRDHYNGLSSVLDDSVQADHVFIGGTLDSYKRKNYSEYDDDNPPVTAAAFEWLKKRGAKPLTHPGNGQMDVPEMSCGSAKLHLLATNLVKEDGSKQSSEARNTSSTVLWIEHGDADFIFAGDATKATKDKILEKLGQEVLDSEVLKVAHHGADNTLHQAWLDAIKPSISMLSSRVGHRYGHPRKTVVDALAKYALSAEPHALTSHDSGWPSSEGSIDKAIFNVGEIGTVTITSDGETLTSRYGSVEQSNVATTKPSDQAGGGDTSASDGGQTSEEPPWTCGKVCTAPFEPCGFTSKEPHKNGKWYPLCIKGPNLDKCKARNPPHADKWNTCK